MDEVRERFAESLIRCRREARLTQRELAARTAMHPTEISLLERRKRTPRIDTLVKLASALRVRPEALLKTASTQEPGTTGRR